MKHNIELYIEELILHGFSPSDQYGIGGAVERELARLFTEHGMPLSLTRSGHLGRLDAGKFEVPLNTKPDIVGSRIAQAVYEEFGK